MHALCHALCILRPSLVPRPLLGGGGGGGEERPGNEANLGTVNTIANLLPTFDTPLVLSSQPKTTETHMGHLLVGQKAKM